MPRKPQKPEVQSLNVYGARRQRKKAREIAAERRRPPRKLSSGASIPVYSDSQLRSMCRRGIPGYNPWANRGNCKFDVKRARRIIDFIQLELTHVKGSLARKPFILERWQIPVVANLIGWMRPDGTRRYRSCLIYVPRKNGKTCLAAAMVLYMLFADGEPGAEIYGCASEYKQASFVFHHAAGMVQQNQVTFGDKLKLYRGQDKAITYPEQLSFYQVLSSDAGSKHGGNTHFAVIDELHTLPDTELCDTIETSIAARDNPMVMYLTTADYDREGSVCNKMHDYAHRVLDGTVEDRSFLPVIYEATRDDDWRSPKVWKKANPNYGVSVRSDYIESAFKKAEESGIDEMKFKRLHLNIRTQQSDKWLDLEKWDDSAGNIEREKLQDRVCYAALDLASVRDLTSLCVLFPFDDHYEALWWFWSPMATAVLRSRRDRAPYLDWANLKGFRLTEGNETDYRVIRQDVNNIWKVHGFRQIAVDRLFQGAQLAQDLGDDGMDVVTFGQGFYSMAAPTAEFDRLVNRGEFHHGGNPCMRWQIGHAAIEQDAAGNMKPSKKKSTEKIDGVVTAIMSLGIAMINKENDYTYTPGRLNPLWDSSSDS